MSQHLLLITPKSSLEGFYIIVGDFAVNAVEVLRLPPQEGGAGDAAYLGGSLYEVGVAITAVGFL